MMKFKEGDRVRMTVKAKAQFFVNPRFPNGNKGTVVGFSANNQYVWIVRDGYKATSREAYHRKFWELDGENDA